MPRGQLRFLASLTFTWIRRSLLDPLGIMPVGKRPFRLAEGTVIEREVGQVLIQLDGETLYSLCVFGDEGTEPLLGAVTLQEFGLAIDPLNKRLVPATLYMA